MQNVPQKSPVCKMPALMTTAMVAELLGVTTRTIRTLVRTGKLPAIYITPDTPRFHPGDVEEFIQQAKGGVR